LIWIWLLLRHSHNWLTGPLERYFTFLCGHCGASTAAFVRTQGSGSGRNHWEAQRAAQAAADGWAHRVVNAAGCPSCGRLSPPTLEQWHQCAKRAARRRAIAVPIAVAVSLLVAIPIAIPAVADLAHSIALSIVAVATATVAGGFFCAVLSSRVMTPFEHPVEVWFSRDPSLGPGSWFRAQPGVAPRIVQPNGALRAASWIATGVGAVTAITALVLYSGTFRKVYVVNTAARLGPVVVSIDGAEVGRVTSLSAPSSDAPFEKFEVRTSSKHDVVLVEPDGRKHSYVLDPATTRHGWVAAPRAFERGLCLTTLTWYYGTTPPKDADDKILNDEEPGELVILPRSFDVLFKEPPAMADQGSTRTTLRALTCGGLEKSQNVPYGSGPHAAE
jgi:hypothetical protein